MKDVFAGKSVGGASPEEIAGFEEFVHASLPKDYCSFLQRFNGGIPDDATCLFASGLDLPGGSEIEVAQFFSLSRNHESIRNLEEALESNVGWVAHTSIPIGCDNFGNLICLDCETGDVEWLLLERRFTLDFTKTFALRSGFVEFLERLGPGAAFAG